MLKLLPCRPKKGPRCRGHAWFGAEPALAARYQGSYSCSKCKNTTELPLVEFNALPSLGIDDVRRLAEGNRKTWGPILRMFRRDFGGAGLSTEQADDLLRAGFRGTVELEPW